MSDTAYVAGRPVPVNLHVPLNAVADWHAVRAHLRQPLARDDRWFGAPSLGHDGTGYGGQDGARPLGAQSIKR